MSPASTPAPSGLLNRIPVRIRLVVILGVLLGVALALVSLTSGYLLQRDLMNRIDQELRNAAVPVAREALSGSPSTLPSAYAVYYIPAGSLPVEQAHPVVTPYLPDIPPLTRDDPRVGSGQPFTIGSQGSSEQWRVIAGSITNSDATYAVAVPLEGSQSTVRRLLVTSLIIGVAAIAASVALGWFAIRRAFRPLTRIEDTAREIAGGDLSGRVPVPPTDDEVSSLAVSLNTMLEQIEASFAVRRRSEAQMRQFVADASHELRTPLATVRGYAELYRQGAVPTQAATSEAMGRIENEATRMNGLVNDLLMLAKLDAQPKATLRDVDLLELASDAVKDARATTPDRQISLIPLHATLGPVIVHGDENTLRQVFGNLMTNALVHTPNASPIEVAIGIDAGDDDAPASEKPDPQHATAVIEVRDHGPGIASESVDLVFERFYRADKARSRANGGSGLGLPIVAAIVAHHDGEIEIFKTPGGGATIRVSLPRAQAPPENLESQSALVEGVMSS